MSAFQTNPAETGDIVDSALGQLIEAEVLVDEISPSSLTSMLKQYVWSSEQYSDHIGVDNLWELMTRNVYLHRLRNRDVLIKCITQGVPERRFGYAETYNGQEYEGLCFGETTSNLLLTDGGSGVLVTPEMAQLVMEEGVIDSDHSSDADSDDSFAIDTEEDSLEDSPTPASPQRIIVTKTIQDDISLDDINLLRDEIIRNLSADGGEVTVNITITANKLEGFSENTTRTMRENSAQLNLDFEQS